MGSGRTEGWRFDPPPSSGQSILLGSTRSIATNVLVNTLCCKLKLLRRSGLCCIDGKAVQMNSANPRVGWEKVGDQFYRKVQLYESVFDPDLELENYLVAGAPYGGAIGTSDDNQNKSADR